MGTEYIGNVELQFSDDGRVNPVVHINPEGRHVTCHDYRTPQEQALSSVRFEHVPGWMSIYKIISLLHVLQHCRFPVEKIMSEDGSCLEGFWFYAKHPSGDPRKCVLCWQDDDVYPKHTLCFNDGCMCFETMIPSILKECMQKNLLGSDRESRCYELVGYVCEFRTKSLNPDKDGYIRLQSLHDPDKRKLLRASSPVYNQAIDFHRTGTPVRVYITEKGRKSPVAYKITRWEGKS